MSLVLCATAIIACGNSARAEGNPAASQADIEPLRERWVPICAGGWSVLQFDNALWGRPPKRDMAVADGDTLQQGATTVSSFGAPLATVVLEISDHFLALGIDRDDRLISAAEIDRLVDDVTKLCVGGKWQTEIGSLSSSASFCSSTFQKRTRYPLLPPPADPSDIGMDVVDPIRDRAASPGIDEVVNVDERDRCAYCLSATCW